MFTSISAPHWPPLFLPSSNFWRNECDGQSRRDDQPKADSLGYVTPLPFGIFDK